MASLVFEVVDAIFWMVLSQIFRSALLSCLAGAVVGVPVLYLDGHATATAAADAQSDKQTVVAWASRAVFLVDAVTLGWVVIAVFWTKSLASVRNLALGFARRARSLLRLRKGEAGRRREEGGGEEDVDAAAGFLRRLTEEEHHGKSQGGFASRLIQTAGVVHGFVNSHMERALGTASADLIAEILASERLAGWKKSELAILNKFVVRGLAARKAEQERISQTEESHSAVQRLLEDDDE